LSPVENCAPVPCPAVLSLKSRGITVSPFAPPALPGFFTTMGLSNSRSAIRAALPLIDGLAVPYLCRSVTGLPSSDVDPLMPCRGLRPRQVRITSHNGNENAACGLGIGDWDDGCFGAQSLHLRCGPASRSSGFTMADYSTRCKVQFWGGSYAFPQVGFSPTGQSSASLGALPTIPPLSPDITPVQTSQAAVVEAE
jgi:hypothetical protein